MEKPKTQFLDYVEGPYLWNLLRPIIERHGFKHQWWGKMPGEPHYYEMFKRGDAYLSIRDHQIAFTDGADVPTVVYLYPSDLQFIEKLEEALNG